MMLAAVLGFVVRATLPGQAQTYSVLYNFCSQSQCTDGYGPSGQLIQDKSGNLYGTTYAGGAYNAGTVFELTTAGTEKVLYSFKGGPSDGASPAGPLVEDSNGNFYGVTSGGGAYGAGTVFELGSSGKETVLYGFTDGNDGGFPNGGLVRDAEGNLYGTTIDGGPYTCFEGYPCGVVFKVTATGIESVVWAFTGGLDDGNPSAGLIGDAKGNLYGTTDQAWDFGPFPGIVFKVTPSGDFTTLFSFYNGATYGESPYGLLMLDAKGNVYGTTYYGGNLKGCTQNYPYEGCGVAYKITPAGTEKVPHAFTRLGKDGQAPRAGFVQDAAGNLYSTTYYGGDHSCYDGNYYGCGVVYELPNLAKGKEIVVYTFTGGIDGEHPSSELAVDSKGSLYGTAAGGANGAGVLFKITR
jgi:uncharacterized repeat protein (TIGR03803 family)